MRKKVLYCAFALIAMFLTNPVLANELTDDYFLIAVNYYNMKDYVKAMEYLDTILAAEPDDLKSKTLRGKILPLPEGSQRPDSCNDVLDNTSDVPSTQSENVVCSSEYYNSKGQEFYIKKEFDKAIKYFYKAINADNKNAKAYNNLGTVYLLKRNNSAAVAFFKKANALDKTFTQPLVNLAMLYKQTGKSQKQLYYLNAAIKANPKDFMAYYSLGDYYRDKLDYDNAISYYKETIKISPQFAQTYLDLAVCFYETKQYNYALIALAQYKELYPDSDYDYYLTAKTNYALEKYDDAKANIEKAISINNTNEYQLELAKIEFNLQNFREAMKILHNIGTDNDNTEVTNYMALCDFYLYKPDDGIDILNAAIVKHPDDKSLYLTKLKLYELLQDNSSYNEVKNLIEVRFKTK